MLVVDECVYTLGNILLCDALTTTTTTTTTAIRNRLLSLRLYSDDYVITLILIVQSNAFFMSMKVKN